MIRIGIDIGSTTAKVAAIAPTGHLIYSGYERHHAQAKETLIALLKKLQEQTGDEHTAVAITGSVGMGFSERYRLPFVQEVVAAVKAIQQKYPSVRSMIDIGGEDAKVVFFDHAEATDLRMNGNCAGGTGAFIDQMAILLGVETSELNRLALNATQVYPIGSVLQDGHSKPDSPECKPGRYRRLHLSRCRRADCSDAGPRMRHPAAHTFLWRSAHVHPRLAQGLCPISVTQRI